MTKSVSLLGLAIVIASATSMAWWWNSPVRFPPPKAIGPIGPRPLRALPPAVPSIPSLTRNRPVPIPGLEKQSKCFTLSLTQDLKQIVFGMDSDSSTGIDLYIAVRDNPTEPFRAPKRIDAVAGPGMEAFPTLSPDGLDLLFVRTERAPSIWVARRETDSSPFATPELWWYSDADGKRGAVGGPQFQSPDQVLFSRSITGRGSERLWSCSRTVGDQFSYPALYAGPEAESFVFVNSDGLRAYIVREQTGIFLTSRPNLKARFFPPDRILATSLTGPVEGNIWVAPQEDVVFYTSPGPGKKIGADRKLWMIGF